MKLLDSIEDRKKMATRASMVALAIDPQNPRPESVQLLKELNNELEILLNSEK